MNEEKKPYVFELIRNRRATKRMLPDYVIEDSKLRVVTEAIRWTSASYGVWDYRILVLPRGKIREELIPSFANQNQFINASHVILFVTAKEKYIKDVLMPKTFNESIPIPEVRQGVTQAVFNNWKQNHVVVDEWAQKQAYIALGSAMIAAADMEIDSGPLEGFNKDEANKILVKHDLIDSKKEQFVVALALGKANLDDPMVHFFDKTRMKEDEFVKFVKNKK